MSHRAVTRPDLPATTLRPPAAQEPEPPPTQPDVRAAVKLELMEASQKLELAGYLARYAVENDDTPAIRRACDNARNALQSIECAVWWLEREP